MGQVCLVPSAHISPLFSASFSLLPLTTSSQSLAMLWPAWLFCTPLLWLSPSHPVPHPPRDQSSLIGYSLTALAPFSCLLITHGNLASGLRPWLPTCWAKERVSAAEMHSTTFATNQQITDTKHLLCARHWRLRSEHGRHCSCPHET